ASMIQSCACAHVLQNRTVQGCTGRGGEAAVRPVELAVRGSGAVRYAGRGMSADRDAAGGLSEAHRRRALVLAVRPEVEGGRYPVKRVIGEPFAIEADIVGDGHDVLRAVTLDRPANADAWRETELVLAGNDTWRATIEFSTLGRHGYTVVAWVDAFAT